MDAVDISRNFSRSMIPPVRLPRYSPNTRLLKSCQEFARRASSLPTFEIPKSEPLLHLDTGASLREMIKRQSEIYSLIPKPIVFPEPITSPKGIGFGSTRSIEHDYSFLNHSFGSSSSSEDEEPEVDTRSTREKLHNALNCFITTACMKAGGLGYDSLELRVLRDFKHGFMSSDSERSREVDHYHQVAPRIVAAVNARPDAMRIWRKTYNLIQEAVALILKKDFEGAREHYRGMVTGRMPFVSA